MGQEKHTRPAQQPESQPGVEAVMEPRPQTKAEGYKPAGKLKGKIALITGGDSGIGRATAVAFAKEGADVAIVYLSEHSDADETRKLVETQGRHCLLIAIDIGQEELCEQAVADTVEMFGRIDILINNAAEQHPQPSIEKITAEQLERTFRTNVLGYFFMTKAALPHMPDGSVIINTSSVTAFKGSATLLDYSSTKGAIVSFTRSLSLSLAKRKIRVNAVAPGTEGEYVAPCYVFLASEDSSHMTGQVLHPNGGEVVG